MNIIVCIKQVPSSYEVEIDPKTGVLKRDKVESKINPYDLYAIETAVSIKEAVKGKVTAITMGPKQTEEILRESMMMGVDDAVMLSDRSFAGADVLATAYTLSQGIKKLSIPDLIICGKQTTDGDTAQTGPEIAAFLNIPHVGYVTQIIKIKKRSIIVKSDMDNYVQILEIPFPCLIAVDTLPQVRLPSFRLKLKTENKKVLTMSLLDFDNKNETMYGLEGSPTRVIKIFPPEKKKKYELWEGNIDIIVDKFMEKFLETL